MGARDDYAVLAVVGVMLVVAILIGRFAGAAQWSIVKYGTADWLSNDRGLLAMFSLPEVPRNATKVSELTRYMTNIGLYGEKVLLTYDRPVEIVGVREYEVQYRVRAIVVIARYSEGGVTNVVIEPRPSERANAHVIVAALIEGGAIWVRPLGIVVNSSEVIEVRGRVVRGGRAVPHAKLRLMVYKLEGEANLTAINVTDVLANGVTFYEVSCDGSGAFRVRVLPSTVPRDHVIVLIASEAEGGYLALKNEPGVVEATLRG